MNLGIAIVGDIVNTRKSGIYNGRKPTVLA